VFKPMTYHYSYGVFINYIRLTQYLCVVSGLFTQYYRCNVLTSHWHKASKSGMLSEQEDVQSSWSTCSIGKLIMHLLPTWRHFASYNIYIYWVFTYETQYDKCQQSILWHISSFKLFSQTRLPWYHDWRSCLPDCVV